MLLLNTKEAEQIDESRKSDIVRHRAFTNAMVFNFKDRYQRIDDDARLGIIRKKLTHSIYSVNRDIDLDQHLELPNQRKKIKSSNIGWYWQSEVGSQSGLNHIHLLLDLNQHNDQTNQDFIEYLKQSFCSANVKDPTIGNLYVQQLKGKSESEYDSIVRYWSKAYKQDAVRDGKALVYDHYGATKNILKSLQKKADQSGQPLLCFGKN